MKPRVKQKIKLNILDLGINGEGIGRTEGFTIFANDALPGELIDAEIVEVKKNYGRAQLSGIQLTSPNRETPICPLFGHCGGCQIMHMKYCAQLEFKRQLVIDSFLKFDIREVDIASCQPSPHEFQYRNKIQLPIRQGRDGLEIGLYARNSHELVPVDHCYVHCEIGEKAYKIIQKILKESRLPPFNFQTGEGILRFLIIKSAVKTGEVLVTLVTNTCDPQVLENCAAEIMQQVPAVKGVIQNVNSQTHNVVLGKEYRLLNGEFYIHENLAGLKFKVSPASFFQVNPWQAENIYAKAIECAQLSGTETVLDAYCGVGTLSLFAAQKAKKVIGVEAVPEAIQDAQYNAVINQMSNVEFFCALSEEYIQTISHLDVLFLNPPRKGCNPAFLEKVCQLKPKRIVYVSCDPGTLARDVSMLQRGGYTLEAAYPFDMFPQTAHVETVVALSKTDFAPRFT